MKQAQCQGLSYTFIYLLTKNEVFVKMRYHFAKEFPMEEKARYTMQDLAKALGISVGTVHRALHGTGRINPETRRKVLDMAEQMHYKVNENAQALRRGAWKIGVLICCPIIQFGDEIYKGIESAFRGIGEFNMISDIRVTPNCNAEQCPDTIRNALSDFCSGSYDAVILFLSGPTGIFRPDFDRLDEAGMPVVTVVNDIPLKNRILHVSADGFTAGKMAANILALCCQNGRIAVLTGSKETHIHAETLRGFTDKQFAKSFEKIDIWEHHDDSELVREQMQQILDNSDSYDGIYITSACTIDVFDLLKDLKKGSCPYLVTTDLFVENRYLLKKQTCTATIFQDPYQQGKKSVNRLYQYLCGQKIEHKLLVTPQLVFPSNEPFVAK